MLRMKFKSLILTNVVILALFGILTVYLRNWEFVFYFIVVAILAALVVKSIKYVDYPAWVLWLLSIWAWLHMAGGLVPVNGSVLYNLILIPIIGEPYLILKFDQVVHAYGFFTATLLMYYVIKPHVKSKAGLFAIPFIAFCAGNGLGALNEVVEFLAVVILPNTNVGGYINTGIDVVSNMIGSAIAALLIHFKLR